MIVITGIIAGMVAVFIRSPIEAYVDTARRAQLTESADTAMRRIARDLRSALPNSVRVVAVGGSTFLEYIPTVGGGRYRQYPTADNTGNVLDFNSADAAFDVFGPVPVYPVGSSVVVFNLGPGSVADAYAGSNRSAVTSANAVAGLFSSDAAPHTVSLAARQFPAPSPSARFHIVETPVTYECNPALGVLRRYERYGFPVAQPTPPAGGVPQTLVGDVAACGFAYTAVHARTGLITLTLQLTNTGESARIVHQIHVQNSP